MGTQRATILRDNMESRIFYRPNDQETAEYIERCLGRKSDYAHSQTLRDGEETSQGRMEQGIPLMTAQEIKQIPDERIIGFHRQLPPFLATRWMVTLCCPHGETSNIAARTIIPP
jgi:type IV secretory pathway TraG/TraD family ATPase VirD4